MKNAVFFLVLVCCLGLGSGPAYSFWIWTPESGRWVNPKHAAKDTPDEQFDFAQRFFLGEDYKKAIGEFKKLIRFYPKSRQAAEAQYYIALSLKKMDKPYGAYLAYEKLIAKYPFSERIEEAVEREYNIALGFIEQKPKKVLGIEIPRDKYSIEILDSVVKNFPYGKYAAPAQYKIGLIMKNAGRFAEARDEFEKVISVYPQSEWAEAAKFQVAICAKEISLDAPYDQRMTKEARERFEKFARAHPDVKSSLDADREIDALNAKEAESNFGIAEFYERQKKFTSAKVYYEYVFTKFPQTKWGPLAFERYQVLEKSEDRGQGAEVGG
ncbi:MAG: tetratricopeptide repeat protein [Candidatus Omnitrophota bacterium]